MEEKTTKYIQSVTRAADIIKCFSSAREELSLVEITTRLGLNKSTVYGLVATLCSSGLLKKCSNNKYCIGPVLTRFSESFQPVGDILYWALKDRIRDIADCFMVSGDLYLYEAEKERFVLKYHAQPKNVQYVISIQEPQRDSFYCCASGKLALAHMPEDQLAAYFAAHPIVQRSIYTIADERELCSNLDEIHCVGYSLEMEEQMEGISAIAVPFADLKGRLLATLSVTGVAFHISKHKSSIIQALRQAETEGMQALFG